MQIDSMWHMTKKRVMIELTTSLSHICSWVSILYLKKRLDFTGKQLCEWGYARYLLWKPRSSVHAGRWRKEKMLHIFYALQLVCKLTKNNYVHETAKLFLCGAVEGIYWPKCWLSYNQYPGARKIQK